MSKQNHRLEKFLTEYLNPKLKSKFDDGQITEIGQHIIDSDEEIQNETNPTDVSNASVNRLIDAIAENPKEIIESIKNKGYRPYLQFALAMTVIISIVVLALMGKLEQSQTATLFGGIVGYILGSSGD